MASSDAGGRAQAASGPLMASTYARTRPATLATRVASRGTQARTNRQPSRAAAGRDCDTDGGGQEHGRDTASAAGRGERAADGRSARGRCSATGTGSCRHPRGAYGRGRVGRPEWVARSLLATRRLPGRLSPREYVQPRHQARQVGTHSHLTSAGLSGCLSAVCARCSTRRSTRNASSSASVGSGTPTSNRVTRDLR